jgi:hypothetical protein
MGGKHTGPRSLDGTSPKRSLGGRRSETELSGSMTKGKSHGRNNS